MTALYSVSGMPRCSLSISISFSSKSLILSWSGGVAAGGEEGGAQGGVRGTGHPSREGLLKRKWPGRPRPGRLAPRQPRTLVLEHKRDSVAVVVGLHGDDIVVSRALQHLGLTVPPKRGKRPAVSRRTAGRPTHTAYSCRRRPPGLGGGARRSVQGRARKAGGLPCSVPRVCLCPAPALCGGGTHHVGQVHAHADVAVTPVVLEPVGPEQEGDQGHVGAVHGLQAEARGRAVEVGISHQLLDAVQHLRRRRMRRGDAGQGGQARERQAGRRTAKRQGR